MPFDAPPDRLQLPQLSGEVVQPHYEVNPIGDIVKQGLDNVNHVIEQFSGLSRAEREAKIAQFAYIRKAYEAGTQGDTRMLQLITGHASNRQERLTPNEIFQNNYAATKGKIQGGGGARPPEDQAGALLASRMALAMQARRAPAQAPAPAAPPPPASGGDIPGQY